MLAPAIHEPQHILQLTPVVYSDIQVYCMCEEFKLPGGKIQASCRMHYSHADLQQARRLILHTALACLPKT